METASAPENRISSRDFFQWGIRKRMVCGRPQVMQLTEASTIRVGRHAVAADKEAAAPATKISSPQRQRDNQVKPVPEKKLAVSCSNNNMHSSAPRQKRITRSQHPVNHIMCTRKSNNTAEVNKLQDSKALNMETKALNMETSVWPKICVTLSHNQIEEDFLAINRSVLPLKPKKRLKSIQRTVQNVTPGVWLSDLSQERYEVKEKKCLKKRPRGLKAMRRAHSESE